MPLITPLAAVPAGANAAPEKLAAGTCLVNEPSGDGLDVALQATGAPVTARPYFWRPVPGHADGGAWVPLGGDGAAGVGSAPVTATPGTMNSCAHGRFQNADCGAQSWILVLEAGVVLNVAWAIVEVVRRALSR